MPSRWFRIPVVGSDTYDNPIRPKYAERADGFSWTDREVFGKSSVRLARLYADEAILDEIAAETDAREISLPVNALNATFGRDRTEAEWREGFHIGDN